GGGGIDENCDALVLDHVLEFLALLRVLDDVGKARAALLLHADAQAKHGLARLGDEVLDPLGGRLGDCDGSRQFHDSLLRLLIYCDFGRLPGLLNRCRAPAWRPRTCGPWSRTAPTRDGLPPRRHRALRRPLRPPCRASRR